MKVRILRTAPYADFSRMPKQGAQILEAGDEIDFPDYYALDIIASKLAELVISYNPDITLGAQELAKEHGIDLAKVKGTGKKGRITKVDVQALLEE